MIKSTNFMNFLKNIQSEIKTDSKPGEQSKNEQTQNVNQPVKFNTGELDPEKDWGGMVVFSTNAQSASNNNNALKATHSNRFGEFLNNILNNANKTIPVIPAGQIGSVEYLNDILKLDNIENYKTVKDEKGRVTELNWNLQSGSVMQSSYAISYGDNNEISIKLTTMIASGSPIYTTTYNSDKEMIRRKYTTSSLSPLESFSMVEEYNNGKLVKETKTWIMEDAHDGVKTEITTYNADGTTTVQKFDADGNLTKEVSGDTTTVYDGKGGYTKTTVDGEGNVLVTEVATKDILGRTNIRTDKADGSWLNVLKDENNNIISAEGKEYLKGTGGIYPYLSNPLADGKGFEFNGMSVKYKGDLGTETEVTYSMNSDGEITINGNNLEINPYSYKYVPGSNSIYGLATMPKWVTTDEVQLDKLVVKGDNNVVNGSKYDDNIKVVGNNNQIDLKDGVDSLNSIGNKNSIKNTENVSMRGKDIPEGEVGSLTYIRGLLNLPAQLDSKYEYSNVLTDDEGRIVAFDYKQFEKGATAWSQYVVSYNDNGEVRIIKTPRVNGNDDLNLLPTYEKTFDTNGKLTQEISNVIAYHDGNVVDSVETVVKNYFDWGTNTYITVDDAYGNRLSDVTKYETETYTTINRNSFTYHENGQVATHIGVLTTDGVELERITASYKDDGSLISENGQITLRANEGRNFGSIMLHNPDESQKTYTFVISADNKRTLNADELEISPVTYTVMSRPWVYFNYTTGATVEVNSQEELNNLVQANSKVIYRPSYEEQMTDISIFGNKNIIRGSYNDDSIFVYGNYNDIDLAEGNDKLRVGGYNNKIKNVEDIDSYSPLINYNET